MGRALLILVAIGIIGGGIWYFTSGKATATPASGTETTTSSASSPVSDETFRGQSSLTELMAKGGSWKCTFDMKADSADSSGTVYIGGTGGMRGDFVSKVPQANMTINSHMIKSGDYMYTWSDMMPQGIKVAVTAANKGTVGSGSTSGQQSFDASTKVNWNCSAWPTEESKFEVPTNITFRTL